MKHYLGIDGSLEACSLCLVDGAGRIMREGKVACEPEAILLWLAVAQSVPERVGLEAGPLSPSAGGCRPRLRRRIERAALDGCTPS